MIYLDNNSTTSLDPEVFSIIQPLMQKLLGNPSSVHSFGRHAKGLLIDAKTRCSRFFNVDPEEILFTSGATEALNFFINCLPKNGHVITSSLEHAAIIEPLKACGREITFLDPTPGSGAVSPSQVQKAVKENTAMIILSGANNETGICIDLDGIAQVAENFQIPFVVDGVALLGKSPLSLPSGVTAACFSGHKIHAPLGVGAIICRKGFKKRPFILGGAQQKGLRAGTENLPAIAGFAKALELLKDKWIDQMAHLRDHFEAELSKNFPDAIIHGKAEKRVCNTSNIAFPGVDGETLLFQLDLAGIAASHGSACSSATISVSRVLLSMGIEPAIARSSIRFSLSRFTTEEEINISIRIITDIVSALRRL